MNYLSTYNETEIVLITQVSTVNINTNHKVFSTNDLPEVVNHLINQGFDLQTQIKPKLQPLFSTESELNDFLETI